MKLARRKQTLFLAALLASLFAALILLMLPPRPEIVGRAILRGAPPPEIAITLPPGLTNLHPSGLTTRHYVVAPDGGLANVFVTIRSGLTNYSAPPASGPVLMENRGAHWEPYVIAVLTNQPVRFRNSSPEMDTVHATPRVPGNPSFSYALLTDKPVPREPWYRAFYRRMILRKPLIPPGTDKSFPLAEPFIRIKCDVHPWHFCYVCVSDHQFFAMTDRKGRFEFPPGLPPGRYLIEARHLRAGVVTQEVVLARGERKKLEFTMEVPPPRTPPAKPTNAPPSGQRQEL